MKNTKLYAYAPWYAPGKFGVHTNRCIICGTLQRVRGLEGNISIGLCVVLFVTSHSAAIGKELNKKQSMQEQQKQTRENKSSKIYSMMTI